MTRPDSSHVEEIEKFARKFNIRRLGEYLQWPIFREGRNAVTEIKSQIKYPHVKVGMAQNGLLVMVLESRKKHSSIAYLTEPQKIEFQQFRRIYQGTSGVVKMVTIFNAKGCGLILKDESPGSFASMCCRPAKSSK